MTNRNNLSGLGKKKKNRFLSLQKMGLKYLVLGEERPKVSRKILGVSEKATRNIGQIQFAGSL